MSVLNTSQVSYFQQENNSHTNNDGDDDEDDDSNIITYSQLQILKHTNFSRRLYAHHPIMPTQELRCIILLDYKLVLLKYNINNT
jgi:hypothetical protein